MLIPFVRQRSGASSDSLALILSSVHPYTRSVCVRACVWNPPSQVSSHHVFSQVLRITKCEEGRDLVHHSHAATLFHILERAEQWATTEVVSGFRPGVCRSSSLVPKVISSNLVYTLPVISAYQPAEQHTDTEPYIQLLAITQPLGNDLRNY